MVVVMGVVVVVVGRTWLFLLDLGGSYGFID